MEPFSLFLCKDFTVVNEKIQKYCSTVYFRSGVNEMLILKNTKNIIAKKTKKKRTQNPTKINNIQTYNFIHVQPFPIATKILGFLKYPRQLFLR